MNTSKVLSATEHFENIFAYASPIVEAENVRNRLVDEGRSDKDIDRAVELMTCIFMINTYALFDDEIPLRFEADRHKYDFIVEYVLKHSEENYSVFVEDIAEMIDEVLKITPLLLNPDVGLVESIPLVSFHECLLAMAIHEARHRLQYNGIIKLFTAPYAKYCRDIFLKNILEFFGIYFIERRKAFLIQGKSQEYIYRTLNIFEFDAVVIANLAASRLHDGLSISGVAQLLTMQPS